MIELLQKGGSIMYIIIACSIIALGIIIERFLFLFSQQDPGEFLEEIEVILKSNDIEKAIQICEQTDSYIARILKVGLLNLGKSKEEIKEAVEEAANQEIPFLSKYLNILYTIAYITPLLGLLGTVAGMITAFRNIEKAFQESSGIIGPQIVAGGIWTALLTTAAGLSVAIPVYVAYNYLSGKVDERINELERISADIVKMITR